MSKKTTAKTNKPAKTASDGTPLNRKGEPKRTPLDSARERALKRLAAHKATQDARADAVVDDGEFDPPATTTEAPTDAKPAKDGPKATKNGKAAKGSPKGERGAKGANTANGAKAAKPAKPAKAKRISALDAAAKVLAESDRPLRAIDMIEVMSGRGLWSSPGGRTPAATLYAAIIREISAKGKDARFKKVDRGMFTSTGKGA